MKNILGLMFAFLSAGCALKDREAADNRMMRDLMRSHDSEVQACFQKTLQKNPNLSSGGLLKIRANNENGQLKQIRLIAGFPGSDALYHCIASKMSGWTLKEFSTRGPADFVWNFNEDLHPLSSKEIQGTMQSHAKDFETCYVNLLSHTSATGSKAAEGRAYYELNLSADGSVESIKEISGFAASAKLIPCLQDFSKNWKFPAPGMTTKIHWAWRYQK